MENLVMVFVIALVLLLVYMLMPKRRSPVFDPNIGGTPAWFSDASSHCSAGTPASVGDVGSCGVADVGGGSCGDGGGSGG
jgi:hypothetical protein